LESEQLVVCAIEVVGQTAAPSSAWTSFAVMRTCPAFQRRLP
jgi:hypothetical protein